MQIFQLNIRVVIYKCLVNILVTKKVSNLLQFTPIPEEMEASYTTTLKMCILPRVRVMSLVRLNCPQAGKRPLFALLTDQSICLVFVSNVLDRSEIRSVEGIKLIIKKWKQINGALILYSSIKN